MSTIENLFRQIGERIRKAREDRGWTQAQLGEALGYSQAAIGNYELGRRHVGLDDLYRIAEALNKPYSFFLGVDRQIEEETRRELEQKIRLDIADFVGVRMLPVISQPIPNDVPLDAGQIEAKMPVPREMAAEADAIFLVSPDSGEIHFLNRSSTRVQGQVWAIHVDGQIGLYRVTSGGNFRSLESSSEPDEPFVVLGRFCGAFSPIPEPPGESGLALVPPTPWDDLDPVDQQQVLQFVEFLRAKKSR